MSKKKTYAIIPKLTLFLCALCFSFSLLAENTNPGNGYGDEDGCTGGILSVYKQTRYRKDATRLALRLQAGNGASYSDISADVPKATVESIYDALIAVHQSKLKSAKAVTQTHKLHTFPTPSVDRFFVVYKRDATWATPLRLGDNITDSKEINSLLEDYSLKIDRHVDWDEEHNSFNIIASNSLNVAPVAKAFSQIEDVVLVDMLKPNGDGNDIEIKKLNNGWELSYMIKFDSCISGCKKKHIWTFKIDHNNEVSFIGESGDSLPDWMTE